MSTSHGHLSGVFHQGDLPPATTLARQLLEQLGQPSERVPFDTEMVTLRTFRELRDALNACLEQRFDRFSAHQFRTFIDTFRVWAIKHAVPVQGAVHADIGCGSLNPYGRMFTHLMAGVGRAYCFETDPIEDPAVAARALAYLVSVVAVDPRSVFGEHPITAREVLANIAEFDMAKLAKGDLSGIPAHRLRLLARSVNDTGLDDGSVHVVFSNSVLEHMPDIDATMAEMARITKPGGFAMHGIDCRDHESWADLERDPLEFLTVDSAQHMVTGCNRKRMFELEQCFARHGFTIAEAYKEPPVPVSRELRSRLVEPWRSMTDEQLGTTWACYLLRKH